MGLSDINFLYAMRCRDIVAMVDFEIKLHAIGGNVSGWRLEID